MEAARTLKLKGHDPILCEAGDALGGQFVLAGKAPRKEEMEAAIQSMASQVQRMGVEVRLNTPVTPELIEEIKPAAVFNCIGATPLIPKIPGAEGAHVANSHDVLAGKVKPTGKVVIIFRHRCYRHDGSGDRQADAGTQPPLQGACAGTAQR